ncbi:MAG: UDP-N-acetylmuramate dehydrogenase [Desulfuromonadaceae bacterium]|nr:UDP-N-acetylmuramate dehydrogenase [Desulfuromonadaceae bacterium]
MKWERENIPQLAQVLEAETGVKVEVHAPLAPLTSWKIGGAADILARPQSVAAAGGVFEFLHLQRWPWVVLGRGTNVLVPDAGIRGVVVQLNHLANVAPTDAGVYTVGAGAFLPELVRICSCSGYSGIEDLAAIPASVGGATVMNAGAGAQSIADVLTQICVIQDGRMRHLNPSQLNFGYRCSGISYAMVVLEVSLKLHYVSTQQCLARRTAALEHRKHAQQVGMPNAGSVFRNPPGASAWKLIDACGLRGCSIGGAQVSLHHTNFIVNTGAASAADVMALITHVQREVYQHCGVTLEPEIRILPEEIKI